MASSAIQAVLPSLGACHGILNVRKERGFRTSLGHVSLYKKYDLAHRCSLTSIKCAVTEERNEVRSTLPKEVHILDSEVFVGTQAQQTQKSEKREEEVEGSGDILDGSIKDAVQAAARALEELPLRTLGTAALYTGVLVLGSLVAAELLDQVEVVPLLPFAMQGLGAIYCGLVASRYWASQQVDLRPASPVGAILELLDGAPPLTGGRVGPFRAFSEIKIPENIDEASAEKLRQLAGQRDAAMAQVEAMRAAGAEIGKVVAEKEALEAVAIQLAQERDSAMSEVGALKSAVNMMTERMKDIEVMLQQEVQRLQTQNQALSTVALQLASERDAAIKEMVGLRQLTNEEKEELELLAASLIEDRDSALAEVEQLKEVVASLSGSASGLTPEMEQFIKAQARDVRSQFISISAPYEEQKEAVDALVAHLVDEFGAPEEWTSDYIQNFLKSSSMQGLGVGATRKETQKIKMAI
eukprot:jgi/Mesen1/1220/ME000129S00318